MSPPSGPQLVTTIRTYRSDVDANASVTSADVLFVTVALVDQVVPLVDVSIV